MKKMNAQKADLREFNSKLREQKAAMSSALHKEYDRRCGLPDTDPQKIFREEVSFESYAQSQKVALYHGSLEPNVDGLPVPGAVVFQLSPNRPVFEHRAAPAPERAGSRPATTTEPPPAARTEAARDARTVSQAQRELYARWSTEVNGQGPPSWLDNAPIPLPEIAGGALSASETAELNRMKGVLSGWSAESERPAGKTDAAAFEEVGVDYNDYWQLELRRRSTEPVRHTERRSVDAVPPYADGKTQAEALAAVRNARGSGTNNSPSYSSEEHRVRRDYIDVAYQRIPSASRGEVETLMQDYLNAAAVAGHDNFERTNFVRDNQLGAGGRAANSVMDPVFQHNRLETYINTLPDPARQQAMNYVQLRVAEVVRDLQVITQGRDDQNNPGMRGESWTTNRVFVNRDHIAMMNGDRGYQRAQGLVHGDVRWDKVGSFRAMEVLLSEDLSGSTGFGSARPQAQIYREIHGVPGAGATRHPIPTDEQILGPARASRQTTTASTRQAAEADARLVTREGREAREMTLDQLGSAIESWSARQDTLGDLTQEMSISIQMYQDRYTKFASTLSNMLKKASETESQIISNMK
jgi:hypothetical protein